MSSESHQKREYLHKRIINESSKAAFKRRLRETSWDAVKGLDNINESYVQFIEKSNNKANSWITKGIAKSSKRKQELYEKFLKNPAYFKMKI